MHYRDPAFALGHTVSLAQGRDKRGVRLSLGSVTCKDVPLPSTWRQREHDLDAHRGSACVKDELTQCEPGSQIRKHLLEG